MAKSACDGTMNWEIAIPEATRNKVLNPSAESADGYYRGSDVEGHLYSTDVDRTADESFVGAYSYHITTTADGQGLILTLEELNAAVHYVTFRLMGRLPSEIKVYLNDGGPFRRPTVLRVLDEDWTLYGVMFNATECEGADELGIIQDGAGGAGDFYIDAVQVEEKAYWTTYCDGDQDGCAWDGKAHLTTSFRSASYRGGGRLKDLYQEYGFVVENIIGGGATPVELGIHEYAGIPGGSLTGAKALPRPLTVIGTFVGETENILNENRRNLTRDLLPWSYPQMDQQYQPIMLVAVSPKIVKYIRAHYEGGLEGELEVLLNDKVMSVDSAVDVEVKYHTVKVPIQFIATDPYWYAFGTESAILDHENTDIYWSVTRKHRDTGLWTTMNEGNFGGDTFSANVYSILVASDGYVYVGGDFDSWAGISGADNIVRYNVRTEEWSLVGPASSLNNRVRDIVEGPNGEIYICGRFTAAGGVAEANYIVRWDESQGYVWEYDLNQDVGNVTELHGMFIDTEGILYFVGNFDSVTASGGGNDIAYAAEIDAPVKYYGGTWLCYGVGGVDVNPPEFTVTGGFPWCVAVDSTGRVYIGGNFAGWNGNADHNYFLMWDNVAEDWGFPGDLDHEMSDGVYCLLIDSADMVYLGGEYGSVAGDTDIGKICRFNGYYYDQMGDADTIFRDTVWDMKISPDGLLWGVGGVLTFRGQLYVWNGASWALMDFAPAQVLLYSMDISAPDPVQNKKYDVYLGFAHAFENSSCGSTEVENNGNVPIAGVIRLREQNVLYGVAELRTIRNETTKSMIMFGRRIAGVTTYGYTVKQGESLTIDLRDTKWGMVSDYSGPMMDAILPNSDIVGFYLLPGTNVITVHVDEDASPGFEVTMEWKRPFMGLE